MRFFCSDFYPNPRNWEESSLEDEEKIIDNYCKEEFYLYDSDCSGEDTYYFAFSSGKYYKVSHEWYWTHDNLENDFYIKEVSKEETVGLCDDRDYLKLIIENKPFYWPKGWKELKEKYENTY